MEHKTLAAKRCDDVVTAARQIFEGDDSVILYHILRDLMEWAQHNKVDFTDVYEEARGDFLSDD